MGFLVVRLGAGEGVPAAAVVLSEPRMKAWRGFVENTESFGRPQGQTMTAGILPLAVARAMKDAGTPFVPVVHVPDTLLVGPKARRHGRRGDALTREQWRTLPSSMVRATWYRDTATGDLVALMPDGTQASVVRTGAIDTVYRDAAAAEKIRSGRWKKAVE
jgi:hypothetical protein